MTPGGVNAGGVDEVDSCVDGTTEDPDRTPVALSPQSPNILGPKQDG
nr:hypothetical protein [Arthrobacter sp. CAL618]